MAKVTITLEDDRVSGNVKIVGDPSFETMARMELSGHDLSAAQTYAIAMMNRAREMSKEIKLVAKIPKVRGL